MLRLCFILLVNLVLSSCTYFKYSNQQNNTFKKYAELIELNKNLVLLMSSSKVLRPYTEKKFFNRGISLFIEKKISNKPENLNNFYDQLSSSILENITQKQLFKSIELVKKLGKKKEDILETFYKDGNLPFLLGSDKYVDHAVKEIISSNNRSLSSFLTCYTYRKKDCSSSWEGVRIEDHLKSGCEAGLTPLCHTLAEIYEFGSKFSLAKKYYRKSCAKKLQKSCFNLAEIFEEENKYKIAMSFFEKSCLFGDLKSCFKLEKIKLSFNLNGSIRRIDQLCSRKIAEACFYKGVIEVENNSQLARKLFIQSCEYGYDKGCIYSKNINRL